MQIHLHKICCLSCLNLCWLLLTPILRAQPVGSPIQTRSHREWTISLNGSYYKRTIKGINHESPRFLLKTIYGFARKVDLFAEIGLARLHLETTGGVHQEFKDKYHPAFGMGLTFRFLSIEGARVTAFLNSGFFRFTSHPVSETILELPGSQATQVVELEYDWREVSLKLGLIKGVSFVDFYAGLNAGWISRLESRTNKNVIDGISELVSTQTGKYQSGLQTVAYFGLDFNMPTDLTVSIEIQARDTSDFMVNLGFSQKGKP